MAKAYNSITKSGVLDGFKKLPCNYIFDNFSIDKLYKKAVIIEIINY